VWIADSVINAGMPRTSSSNVSNSINQVNTSSHTELLNPIRQINPSHISEVLNISSHAEEQQPSSSLEFLNWIHQNLINQSI